MQKNHLATLKKLLRTKGAYAAALLCVGAVGLSGYLFATGREAVTEVSSARVPQIVATPEADESTPPAQRNASVDAASVQPPRPAVPEPEPAAFTMVMPVEGDLIQCYSADHLSYDPTTRDWRVHDGIDICAGASAEVRAAADGTVASIYEDEALGTVLTISHQDGYLTRYANLDAPCVAVGQRVAQGEAVATVGASALMESAQPSHLHFELCQNACSLDPADFFTW